MKKGVIILFAVMMLSSCFKDEEYSTLLNIKTTEQYESGGDGYPLYDVVAYLYAPSGSGYSFDSFDSALAGEAKKSSGAVVAPIAMAQSVENLTLLNVTDMEEVFVLVVDTLNECYASATLDIGLNLANTYLSLQFRPWQTTTFTQGSWTFINTTTNTDE